MASVRKFLNSHLSRIKKTLVNTVPPASIEAFVNSVKPVQTNHDLIRVGNDSDGGYLVPDDLEGIKACFSPGVSTTADFEKALAGRGIECYLADFSVESPPLTDSLFHFEKKFLGVVDQGEYMTLESWVWKEIRSHDDLILQMDIEGGEYEVILSTRREVLRKFRIIVVEFHDFNDLVQPHFFRMARLAFDKLLQDFDVVHIHPNNNRRPIRYKSLEIPPLMEFSFLRKDRIVERRPVQELPHPLDRQNVAGKPPLNLSRQWYS